MRILISHLKSKTVNLSNYSLKYVLPIILSSYLFSSCSEEATLYKRTYTDEEQKALGDRLLTAAGNTAYYQGSPGERAIIFESDRFLPSNGDYYREIGVPYLKRGFAATAYKNYRKAADLDPLNWAGYMAYCWLYFYRDYEMTLQEVEHLDTLTPNFVDYPQSTSVDYMRGVSHLQLGHIDTAIHYLDKHLKFEIESSGEQYVEVMPYQMLGIAYYKKRDFRNAEKIFDEGIKYNSNSADIHYYRSLNYLKMGNLNAAKNAYKTSKSLLDRGIKNTRPYVEEFYAIYPKDLDRLKDRVAL